MQDPKPSNIAGKKVRTHSFEHQIRWDYLLIGLVVGYTAWKLFGGLSSSSEEEGEEIEIEAVQDSVAGMIGG